MPTEGFDFLGRLRGIIEMFGPVGLFLIIIAALVIAVISLWRGVGPILFFLFISYSFSAVIQGGVIFLSTLVRWSCLILCLLGFFKMSSRPKSSMLLFVFYAFLGLLFVGRSTVVLWSLQRAVLLILVVLCVPVAINSYITGPDKVRSLFKMGIVAATVWVGVSLLFLKDYLYTSDIRFGGEITGGVAWAGAFFSPMIFWGIIQKREVFWRIYSAVLIMPFVFLLFIGGVRTAIFGMLIIASLPILFSKIRPIKVVGTIFGVGALIAIIKYFLFALLPGRAASLTGRVFSTSTTGRTILWAEGLRWCTSSAMFYGHGIGSADIAVMELGHNFHNAFLTIWYNTGFVGLLAVLLFLFIYTMRGFNQVRRYRTGEIGEYSRIALGYMLGITALSMFENSISSSSGVAVFMLMVIVALVDRLSQMGDQYFYGTCAEDDDPMAGDRYQPQEIDSGGTYVLY
jgi:O-antigen ligase